jgi:hypothetical protein
MNLLYLIGAPGVGKSAAMRALTAGCDRRHLAQPLHHEQLIDPRTGDVAAVELGRTREGFPGTDTLPLHAGPIASAWVGTHPAGLLLAEGDRLAHRGFLDAAAAAGYTVHLAHLTADRGILDARCAARGSTQHESWRQGRATKDDRLAATGRYGLVGVPTGNATPAEVAAGIRAAHPFLTVLP